jgi:hypothetical protein
MSLRTLGEPRRKIFEEEWEQTCLNSQIFLLLRSLSCFCLLSDSLALALCLHYFSSLGKYWDTKGNENENDGVRSCWAEWEREVFFTPFLESLILKWNALEEFVINFETWRYVYTAWEVHFLRFMYAMRIGFRRNIIIIISGFPKVLSVWAKC